MLKMILALSFLFNFNFVFAQDTLKVDATRLWQKRDDQKSLEESLSKFEQIHKANPNDIEALTYLTRGYYTLAELHLTDDNQKLKTFEKARNFGELGMATNPEFRKHADKDIEKAIDQLTAREVPVCFWAAAALGKWAKLNGIMSSLKFKGQILSMIKKVEKLKPDYFHGAVPRYWGGFYAVAPSIAGGDMGKSKENFMKAMQIAPEYLGTKTLYAELYLVKKDNKKDFKKTLEEVLAAPVGPEDIAPENKLEKKKAQRLLDNTEELF